MSIVIIVTCSKQMHIGSVISEVVAKQGFTCIVVGPDFKVPFEQCE